MRITTKVIQNNSVTNINNNKVLQDKLNNQMSTEKKIVRPSDDPVIAIRALRLRTNVSQVTQYYSKNIPDAESWMSVTESALTTVSSVLTDMIQQCTKGASEKLTPQDRQTILNALTALRDEVYATGNADYAGRSVFTGYRTETTLKFTESESKKYSITEQIGKGVIDSVTYVNSDYLNNLNEVNYTTGDNADIVEQDIHEDNIYRIRLSYSNVDNEAGTTPPTITLMDGTSYTAEIISNTATPSPYQEMITTDADNEGKDPADMTDRVILIPETGELLISKSIYNNLMALEDDVTTATKDEAEIRVTYEKSRWVKDDLKPEHYFACTDATDADSDNWIKYNQGYLAGLYEKQSIEYDVGLNQSIRVNTTADEVFRHAIGRDVDDLVSSMQQVIDMETTLDRLTKIKDNLSADDPDYLTNLDIVTKQIDAVNKSLTYLKEKNQELFEGSITKMQSHLDTVNYATTNCGTREKKLELIKNRLMSQKTNFETLQSENENVDLTDVAIELSGAELTYQAALMSTSKILQTSLMQYI